MSRLLWAVRVLLQQNIPGTVVRAHPSKHLELGSIAGAGEDGSQECCIAEDVAGVSRRLYMVLGWCSKSLTLMSAADISSDMPASAMMKPAVLVAPCRAIHQRVVWSGRVCGHTLDHADPSRYSLTAGVPRAVEHHVPTS